MFRYEAESGKKFRACALFLWRLIYLKLPLPEEELNSLKIFGTVGAEITCVTMGNELPLRCP